MKLAIKISAMASLAVALRLRTAARSDLYAADAGACGCERRDSEYQSRWHASGGHTRARHFARVQRDSAFGSAEAHGVSAADLGMHLSFCRSRMPTCHIRCSCHPHGTGKTPAGLIVDLHGLNITPLQQILFDGTTDFAEKYGFMVVAPMGYSVTGGWGGRAGAPIATAAVKPGSDAHYSASELSELDAMTLLKLIREKYPIDANRIFLMGHSLGGQGTYYLGGKYNDIWAGLAPISGAGGIADAAAAEKYKAIPMLIMHGDKDSIVQPVTSRRSVLALQAVGAPHVYLEFPGMDHEFWIRRGAAHMEKVFLFFSMLSKQSNPGFMTPEMAPPRAGR